MLQGYVALSKGLKIAVALLFLVGTVLMPYGIVRGLGEFRGVDEVYLLGVGLVGLALLANLWGVLRFSAESVEPKKL